jgi:exopolyphosphatase/guanosine-5'-triphosphate,3'-diphosphate pyrophosphatase
MRVAVVDCGTNTIRLLISEPGSDGTPRELVRRLELVRLGQGVDATRTFHPDALQRTFAALDTYAAIIAEHAVGRVRFLATSAARDVTNREDFFTGVRERLGVGVDVISGDEEARLSFLGALSGGTPEAGPVLVMDVGGGSTELILGDPDGTIRSARSLDVGSVRIRERFLADDPPTAAQIAAARSHVADLITGSGVDVAAARTWIGVAGTTTSLSALAQRLADYDRAKVHNSTVTPGDLHTLADDLLATPVEALIARSPLLPRLRAEVICAGALICSEVSRAIGDDVDMTVRETDILDGATLELLS